MKETPRIISIDPITLPVAPVGTTSPYPTVVTVWRAHQTARPNDGKLLLSRNQIATPPTTERPRNVVARASVIERASAIFLIRRSMSAGLSLLCFGEPSVIPDEVRRRGRLPWSRGEPKRHEAVVKPKAAPGTAHRVSAGRRPTASCLQKGSAYTSVPVIQSSYDGS